MNKPYVYVENRVGVYYFLNMPSSRLDWMHPYYPWLEKYLTVNISLAEKSPNEILCFESTDTLQT